MNKFLNEAEARYLDAHSKERFLAHRKVLERKKQIVDVFNDFHALMMNQKDIWCRAEGGQFIELGAGVYPLKENYPTVQATDVVAGPLIDRLIDAQKMELDSSSVSAIFGQNCFHHFPNPEQFFEEALRVLKPGGVVVLIDPSHTFLSSILYPKLFSDEGYDKSQKSWGYIENQNKPNQALSSIVFQRDREQFLKMFPQFELVHEEVINSYARYLLSGGLNFRALLPNFLFPLIGRLEKTFPFLSLIFGLHHLYILRKKSA